MYCLSTQGSTSAEPVILIHTSVDQNFPLLLLLRGIFSASILEEKKKRERKVMITVLKPQY